MSTADCKDLLVETYPNTCAKAWKRAAKFKNLHNEDIRLFTHPEVGQVWVNESEQSLSTDATSIVHAQASALTAADFYVAFGDNPGDGILDGPWVMAVYKPFFDTHGHFESIHLGGVMERIYPKDLIFGEDQEATFGIYQDIPLTEVKRLFREAGFVIDEKVQALFDEP
ncbi:hypothetical protein [Pseudomonas amygdali]|uniref:Uncharacterized protein n=2 Tax=Pseudomonas amygdali pv. lachrymans TaxID=53707 RepID=A0ABR5KSV8_PSEAV|nr:hypothetical protein [Pseudomonas amygdali]AXH59513.1 hypothetical protein PLA107_030260 [Pseudomonas amygdali pv. lachrymans str. M301315]KPC16939.1 Uncharacterized protein AC499_0141 [Pseudomonas amygdali pv. lachrymans]KPC17898.1 Uncharacterized protein AC499_1100 [Pseudomonas amygdali pv. lachrymans]RMT06163.1 hypothetical protein ALP54_03438 [Pseudomonas amygdali pv. lachrymans]